MRTTTNSVLPISRLASRALAAALAVAAGAALPFAPGFTPRAAAQDAGKASPISFVVTASADVPLRSGNYTVFYPVARLKQGQVLAVTNSQDADWLEVAYPAGTPAVIFAQEGELRERNGKKFVVTTRRTSLSAFNIAASGRSDHYKRVFRSTALQPGTELAFIAPLTDPQSGEVYAYKVEAPANATGYISRADIRAAGSAEAAQYLASLGLTHDQLAQRLGVTNTPAATTTADAANTPATPNQPSTGTPTDAPATTLAGTPVEGDDGATITMGAGDDPASGLIAARLDEPPPAAEWKDVEAVKKLDAAYDAMSAEPLEKAEITPLMEEYKALLATVPDEENTRSVRDYINARIMLLELRGELQKTLADLRTLETSHKDATQRLESASQMALRGVEYSLTGRLERSALYDGERLPLRYRLEVPGDSLRTLLAYVEAPKGQNLDLLIGKTVTVQAKDRIDPKGGLNVIHAREVSESASN